MRALYLLTTHGQNNTRRCDTEGFIPVKGLNCVVKSPSFFISYLIGSTGKYDISYTLMQN